MTLRAHAKLGVAGSLLVALLLTACDARTRREVAALLSNAQGVIQDLSAEDDVGLVNNEPDYGIKVSFQIENVGDAGLITIEPWVSSSEGEWHRRQKVAFAAGERRSFSYFFHEPSIGVSSVQYGVQVHPRPDKP